MLDALFIDENDPVFVASQRSDNSTTPRDRHMQSHLRVGAGESGEVALGEQRAIRSG